VKLELSASAIRYILRRRRGSAALAASRATGRSAVSSAAAKLQPSAASGVSQAKKAAALAWRHRSSKTVAKSEGVYEEAGGRQRPPQQLAYLGWRHQRNL